MTKNQAINVLTQAAGMYISGKQSSLESIQKEIDLVKSAIEAAAKKDEEPKTTKKGKK